MVLDPSACHGLDEKGRSGCLRVTKLGVILANVGVHGSERVDKEVKLGIEATVYGNRYI